VIWPGPSSGLPLSCLLAPAVGWCICSSTVVPAGPMPLLVALPSSWVGQPWLCQLNGSSTAGPLGQFAIGSYSIRPLPALFPTALLVASPQCWWWPSPVVLARPRW
jgi:hypothetical protein